MKFVVFSALSILVSVVTAFHVEPPASITACEPVTVGYDTTTGTPPFSLSFRNGSADGPVLAAFTNVTGTSFTWSQVTIPAGTGVVIQLADSDGLGSSSGVITVASGGTCAQNPTSIPTVPSITTSHPPSSGSLPLSTSTNSSVSSSTNSGLSSSLTSLSSVISSANSRASSLTGTTSSPKSTSSGLSANAGVTPNAAGIFTLGAMTVFIGAFLA